MADVKSDVDTRSTEYANAKGRFPGAEESALDITVTPEPLGTDSGLSVQKDLTDRRFDVVGSTQSTGGGGNVRIINAGADDLSGVKVFTPRGRAASVGADGGGDKGDTGGGNKGGGGSETGSGKEIKDNRSTIG